MPLGAVASPTKAFHRPSDARNDNFLRTTVEPNAEMDPQSLTDLYGEPEEPEPWDGYDAFADPRGIPYYSAVGIHRFKGWHLVEKPEVPPGWQAPRNHLEYRELLEAYCMQELTEDLEAVTERMTLHHEILERRAHPPSWLTLDLGDSTDLRQWSRVLRELEIDESAQASLKFLADDPSGWGSWEVNRILAHLFKDTASAIAGHQVLPRRSAWVSRACQEANMALRNMDEWDCDHQRASGLVWTMNPSDGRWAWHVAPRGASSTSTEEGPWSSPWHQGLR